MSDKGELLDLARRCRSLSARSDDDATVRSLDRLADDYETQARVIDYLAGQRTRAVDMPIPVARASNGVAQANSLAPHA